MLEVQVYKCTECSDQEKVTCGFGYELAVYIQRKLALHA